MTNSKTKGTFILSRSLCSILDPVCEVFFSTGRDAPWIHILIPGKTGRQEEAEKQPTTEMKGLWPKVYQLLRQFKKKAETQNSIILQEIKNKSKNKKPRKTQLVKILCKLVLPQQAVTLVAKRQALVLQVPASTQNRR